MIKKKKKKPYATVEGKDLTHRRVMHEARANAVVDPAVFNRSALSNGNRLMLADVDMRLPWCRRLRDLVDGALQDLGGVQSMSNAELVLVRRACFLALQAEMIESRTATDQDGKASPRQLLNLDRILNTLRRTFECLQGKDGGLKRRAQDITPVSHSELRSMLNA